MTTLTQLCAEYLRARAHELEESTQQLVARACRFFDLWQAERAKSEGVPPADLPGLTKAHGNLWKGWLIDTGRGKNTANIYLRAMRPVLSYAVDSGYMPANPFDGVKEFHVTPRPVTIYEDWQFERMLYHLPKATAHDPQRDIRWLGILWGARTTGMRRGELLNLTAENIRGGFVWVEPKKKTADTWLWEPKDRDIRKLPLAPQFAAVLTLLRDRKYLLLAQADYDRMIKAQAAGTLTERARKCPELNFRRTFTGIQRRAFGQQIGDFHQLRRTFTTHLAEVLPDKALMELTGHTKRETLDRYTGVRQSHLQVAYEAICGILKKGSRGLQPGFGGFQSRFATPDIV